MRAARARSGARRRDELPKVTQAPGWPSILPALRSAAEALAASVTPRGHGDTASAPDQVPTSAAAAHDLLARNGTTTLAAPTRNRSRQ